jgi:hypothetical protein
MHTYSAAFSARIRNIGINPCVAVPRRVSDAFGKRGPVPVRGTLDGHAIRATLVPIGGGRHRLYINGFMRKAAGVGVGDVIGLALRPSRRRPPPRMPAELATALARNAEAAAAWERRTPSRRKEMLTYLSHLKTTEARGRTVRKILALLRARRRPGR